MPLTPLRGCFCSCNSITNTMSSAAASVTAVILAAGLGERLRSVQMDEPKGFIAIGGGAIIARSLTQLTAAGVRDIVLVAGWREESYRALLAAQFPAVRLAINPDYATTGSLASLLIGCEGVAGDVLVVESDLLYESRARGALLAAPRRRTLLARGRTGSGGVVGVYARVARLAHLSKQAWGGAPRVGELVGLTRLSRRLAQALVGAASNLTLAAHYEDGLNAVCAQQAVDILCLDDLAWCEIDDAAQLARARNEIWPRIGRAEQAMAKAGR